MKHKPLFLRVVATLLALFIGHTGWAEEPARDAASDTASDTETAAFVIPEKSEASAGSDTDARPANDDIFVLDDFVVSAEDDRGYYAANSISATRTNALVKNTPISISVINEQMMEDLNILNDQDLVRATSSVSEDPDGFSLNQLRIRGFRSLTQRYDLFWREITRDGYNIQRVDIVKGANSLMYGQADPGGQINSVPKMAQIGKDFANFKHTAGNKDYSRSEVDFNYSPSDKFAVRLMGVDFSRDLDQLYEYADISGATLEAMYRPNSKTQLRAHIETIELDQNLAPNMFVSANDQRFDANSPQDDTLSGNPSFTLGTYRNEFIYSPDAIKHLPQEIIDDLILDTAYAEILGDTNPELGIDETNPEDVTREVLNHIYAPWASQDDRYSVTGPDKYNRRSGLITTVDWTQQVSDDLQFKIAVNREDDDTEALAREGYGAGRVVSSPNEFTLSDGTTMAAFEPYVEPHWRYQEGETKATAVKSTLLWDVELDDNIPVIGNSEHKILLGADYDKLERDSQHFKQVDENDLREGLYFRSPDLLTERFYLSNGFGPNTPDIGFNGQPIDTLSQETEAVIKTRSLWFAIQSSFMNERLRTLAGLRYDNISTVYSRQDYRFSVGDNFVTNNLDGDYSRAVTNIEDANVKDSQVSPTIGALYWLTDDIAFFANYAQSIQSPTNVELTPLGEIIPPVFGEGYEYGFRFDLLDGKLNGQITAFYIEKENDTIVNYDWRLREVYPASLYGATHPQIYNNLTFNEATQEWEGTLNNNLLPGKRVPGDISRSEGLEVDFYYNPNRNLSFVFSYSYNNLDAIYLAASEIDEDFNPRFAQVFGQAAHNALFIGRYKFTEGPLKRLTIGANQRFRSSSTMGHWYIEDDNDAAGEGTWYEIDFDPEFVTDAFMNYQMKLGTGRKKRDLYLGLRVNNLFDTTELIQRNKSAYHRPSRQYLLSASMRF
jgi:outer membrane receptor protein involved in Fe transport